MDIFNIPWRNEKENNVIDNEAESSRSFNTRIVKISDSDEADGDGIIKEIVEPILKPHSNKNARAHDPDKEKSEITEPILGPTTAKNKAIKTATKVSKSNKEFNSVYEQPSEWVPQDIPIVQRNQGKSKREDDSRVFTGFDSPKQENPLDTIATTVQFLPQRLARMFEQAEKYARDTILPLVSTYTPKFISDFIAPKDNQPKYLPLSFEEPTTTVVATSVETRANEARSLVNRHFDSPRKTTEPAINEVTTSVTHIQRIKKKEERENEEMVFPVTAEQTTQKATKVPARKEVSRKTRDDIHVSNSREKVPAVTEIVDAPVKNDAKAIYVDLPVFDGSEKKTKYIPLT